MSALTRDDIVNLKHVASLSGQFEEHELDFSDDRQWHHFMGLVHRSGVTEDSHPEYLRSLRQARDEDKKRGGHSGRMAKRRKAVSQATGDTMQDANTISNFGVNTGKTASLGAAFSAIVNGTTFTSLYVQLIDLSDDKVLGENSLGPVFGEGEYLPIDLTGQLPQKENMLMVFTWSYMPPATASAAGAKATATPIQGSMRVSTNELPVGAPNVVQPIRTVTTKNNIKIGLGRPTKPADCDYWYNEPNIQTPNIRLPLVMSQAFQSNIKQPLWPTNITNPPTIFQIKTSTGGVTTPVSMTQIQNGITANGNELQFTFPFNNDVALDQSVRFGSAAWANDTTLLTMISLGVKTETSNNEFVWMNLYGSDTAPWAYSPAPGMYVMYPNYYTWHCVAADTAVTLADGSTKKIGDITGGEKVKIGANGEVFTVVDTFGTNKEADVLVIRTEAGHELLITHLHPLLTTEGLVAARDLLVGDQLITDKGPSRVKSIDTQSFTGMVWGIGVGATPDEEAKFTDDNTCFFANGILIADNRVCVEFVKNYKRRLSTVLARIPERFHPEAKRSYEQRYGKTA